MQRICEIHAAFDPVQGLGHDQGIAIGHAGQATKCAQCTRDVWCPLAVRAAQDLFRLQQNPHRNENGFGIHQGTRPAGLVRVIARQVADDDIRIKRDHGACGPRPEQRRPCLPATPAGDLSQGAQRPDPAPWARKLGTRTPAPGPIMPLPPPGSIASARPSPASDQSAGSAHSPTITRRAAST